MNRATTTLTRTAASRRERLRAFLGCRTIADYLDADHHDSAYHESWGRPLSLRRLHRMQGHLHWLLRFQGADARKAVAREHWRQDLAWIRTVLGPMVAGPGRTPVKWAGRQDG